MNASCTRSSAAVRSSVKKLASPTKRLASCVNRVATSVSTSFAASLACESRSIADTNSTTCSDEREPVAGDPPRQQFLDLPSCHPIVLRARLSRYHTRAEPAGAHHERSSYRNRPARRDRGNRRRPHGGWYGRAGPGLPWRPRRPVDLDRRPLRRRLRPSGDDAQRPRDAVPPPGEGHRPSRCWSRLRRAPARRPLRGRRRSRRRTALQRLHDHTSSGQRPDRGLARLHRHRQRNRCSRHHGALRPRTGNQIRGDPRRVDGTERNRGSPPGLPAGGLVTATLPRAAALGAVTGAAWGVLARIWMRLISGNPEFSWTGTLLIIGFAAMLGGGLGLAARARLAGRSRWWTLAVVPGFVLCLSSGMVLSPSFLVGSLAYAQLGRILRVVGWAVIALSIVGGTLLPCSYRSPGRRRPPVWSSPSSSASHSWRSPWPGPARTSGAHVPAAPRRSATRRIGRPTARRAW